MYAAWLVCINFVPSNWVHASTNVTEVYQTCFCCRFRGKVSSESLQHLRHLLLHKEPNEGRRGVELQWEGHGYASLPLGHCGLEDVAQSLHLSVSALWAGNKTVPVKRNGTFWTFDRNNPISSTWMHAHWPWRTGRGWCAGRYCGPCSCHRRGGTAARSAWAAGAAAQWVAGTTHTLWGDGRPRKGHPRGRRAWRQTVSKSQWQRVSVNVQQRAALLWQFITWQCKNVPMFLLRLLGACQVYINNCQGVYEWQDVYVYALTSHKLPGHFSPLLKPELSICTERDKELGRSKHIYKINSFSSGLCLFKRRLQHFHVTVNKECEQSFPRQQ